MTNEELSVSIQNGNFDLLPDLWQNVERLVYYKATGYYLKHCKGKNSIEIDDLAQSGYFALLDAVKLYKQDSEIAFSTCFCYQLFRQFADTVRINTKQGLFENCVLSLDAPVAEGEELTIGDSIADPVDRFESIEDAMQTEQLHRDLDEFMQQTLTAEEVDLLNAYYYADKTIRQLSAESNEKYDKLNRIKNNAISRLRVAAEEGFAEMLESYISDSIKIKTCGLNSFLIDHTSQCERWVLDKEYLTEKFYREVISGKI